MTDEGDWTTADGLRELDSVMARHGAEADVRFYAVACHAMPALVRTVRDQREQIKALQAEVESYRRCGLLDGEYWRSEARKALLALREREAELAQLKAQIAAAPVVESCETGPGEEFRLLRLPREPPSVVEQEIDRLQQMLDAHKAHDEEDQP